MNEKRLETKEQINKLDEKLPTNQFQSVHRIYLVSMQKVTALYGSILEIGEIKIPVGRNYKAAVDGVFTK
ncbi:MAG: LytTR family transcriptional regulator DNA-binding domain-containing protein [Prolixibacteraceae bacterium]